MFCLYQLRFTASLAYSTTHDMINNRHIDMINNLGKYQHLSYTETTKGEITRAFTRTKREINRAFTRTNREITMAFARTETMKTQL